MRLQLSTRGKTLLPALASATGALLGTPAAAAEAQAWDVDIATLIFTEFEKVSGTEVVLQGRRPLSDSTGLTLGAVFDVLIGASPNGATPSDAPQTFTTPSGFDSYRISARDEPLDDSFQDNRLEVSAAWDRRYSRSVDAVYGGQVSMEFDYLAAGANTRWTFGTESLDTLWTLAGAVSHERIHPVGGIPIPLASMQPADTPQPRKNAALTKNVFDLLLGVSQVLGARTVVQFNYSQTYSEGYHVDPYKLVSVVDATTGRTVDYVHEERPDTRTVQGFFSGIRHRLDLGVLNVGARYTDDDWGVESVTLDLRLRLGEIDGSFWEPHLRLYTQNAADFYTHSTTDATPLRGDLSADRRLADFDAVTLGLKYGQQSTDGEAFSISVEYYRQFGDESPGDAIGVQRDLDLFPETEALLVQLSNTFVW